MILFKQSEFQREFVDLDPRIQKIVYDFECMAMMNYGEPIVITDMWRADPGSPHHYWRAVDIALLKRGNNEWLRTYINEKYPYGDGVHETCPKLDHGMAEGLSTGPHYHFQCREET